MNQALQLLEPRTLLAAVGEEILTFDVCFQETVSGHGEALSSYAGKVTHEDLSNYGIDSDKLCGVMCKGTSPIAASGQGIQAEVLKYIGIDPKKACETICVKCEPNGTSYTFYTSGELKKCIKGFCYLSHGEVTQRTSPADQKLLVFKDDSGSVHYTYIVYEDGKMELILRSWIAGRTDGFKGIIKYPESSPAV